MLLYGLLDEAKAHDERFALVCNMLMEQMASYIILRDFAMVS